MTDLPTCAKFDWQPSIHCTGSYDLTVLENTDLHLTYHVSRYHRPDKTAYFYGTKFMFMDAATLEESFQACEDLIQKDLRDLNTLIHQIRTTQKRFGVECET